jgi:hypothetical protein
MPVLGIVASQISGHLFAPSGAYDSIATTTVGSGGTASITFSSIPQTYTHLQIRYIGRSTLTGDVASPIFTFNGDTGSNYTFHQLYGEGSIAGSTGSASQVRVTASQVASQFLSSNIFGAGVIDILDYASTSKYKTQRSIGGFDANGSGALQLRSGVWMNTAAITSITFALGATSDYMQYSQFALYGIRGGN